MENYMQYATADSNYTELAISFTRHRYLVIIPFHLDKNNNPPKICDGVKKRMARTDISINFKKGSYYYDYTDNTTQLSKITIELIHKGYISLIRITQTVAGFFKVSYDTFVKWEKENEEFSRAIKEGLAKSQYFWEKLGIDITTGKVKGNATTWIFNMKNRFNWRDVRDEEQPKIMDEIKDMTDEELEIILKDLSENA